MRFSLFLSCGLFPSILQNPVMFGMCNPFIIAKLRSSTETMTTTVKVREEWRKLSVENGHFFRIRKKLYSKFHVSMNFLALFDSPKNPWTEPEVEKWKLKSVWANGVDEYYHSTRLFQAVLVMYEVSIDTPRLQFACDLELHRLRERVHRLPIFLANYGECGICPLPLQVVKRGSCNDRNIAVDIRRRLDVLFLGFF